MGKIKFTLFNVFFLAAFTQLVYAQTIEPIPDGLVEGASTAVVEDTWVGELAPDANNDGEADLNITQITGDNREAWISFDLTGMGQADAVVVSVSGLQKGDDPVNWPTTLDSFFVDLLAVPSNPEWTGDALTWNNKPATGAVLATASFAASGNRFIDFTSSDLTELVNSMIAAGESSVTFALAGKYETPGTRGWISGQEWEGAKLRFMVPEVNLMPQGLVEGTTAAVIEDTWVGELVPDANNDGEADLNITQIPGDHREAWISFDLTGMEQGDAFALSVSGLQKGDDPVNWPTILDYFYVDLLAVPSNPEWTGDALTWNNKPATGAVLATASFAASGNRFIDFTSEELTTLINSMIVAGESSVTFALVGRYETPGTRGWISGQEWEGAKLRSMIPDVSITAQDLEGLVEGASTGVVEDTWVGELEPDANNDGEADLNITQITGDHREAWISFDLTKMGQADAVVVSVSGLQKGDDPVNWPTTLEHFYVDLLAVPSNPEWTGDALTWNNKPATGAVLATASFAASGNRFIDFTSEELTTLINSMIAAEESSVTFALVGRYETPGTRGWISGQEWEGAKLRFMVPEVKTIPEGLIEGTTAAVMEDTWVGELEPDNNNDGEADLNITQIPGNHREAWISFDLTEMEQSDAVVLSVTGLQKGDDPVNWPDTLGYFYVDLLTVPSNPEWTGDALTWNNKPATGEILATASLAASGNRFVDFVSDSLTELVNSMIVAGESSVTFALVGRYETPGTRGWISGQEWEGAKLRSMIPDVPVVAQDLDGLIEGASTGVVEDTWVGELEPDANNDGEADLNITQITGDHREAWISFDLTKMGQADAVVLSVTGLQKGDDPVNWPDTLENFYVDLLAVPSNPEWTGDALTWNNKPATGAVLATASFGASGNRFVDFTSENLTALINDMIAAEESSVTFALVGRYETPGTRGWISGQEWEGAKLRFMVPEVKTIPEGLMVGNSAAVMQDTWVGELEPDANNDGEADLNITQIPGDHREAWVSFDLTGLGQADEVVLSVTGLQKGDDPVNWPDTLDYFYVNLLAVPSNPEWTGDALTWNNKPATGEILATASLAASGNRFIDFTSEELTTLINSMIVAGESSVTFALVGRYETPGTRGWISGQEWEGAKLQFMVPDFIIAGQDLEGLIEGSSTAVVEDTWVGELEPDANNDGEADLNITQITGDHREAWISFDLTKMGQADAVVLSVTGLQKGDDPVNWPDTLENFYVDLLAVPSNPEWTGDALTWNNKPATGAVLATASFGASGNRFVDFTSVNLTALINDMIAAEESSVTFALVGRYETPGTRGWISGQEWEGAKLRFMVPEVDTIPDGLVEDAVAPVMEDTWVGELDPDNNNDGEADLNITQIPGDHREAWVSFDLTGLGQADEVVLSVTGLQKGDDPVNWPDTLDYFYVNLLAVPSNPEWTGDALTWNNKPATGEILATASLAASGNRFIDYVSDSLTALVNSMIEAGESSVTFALVGRYETPGTRGWISGQEWEGAKLRFLNEEITSLDPITESTFNLYPNPAVDYIDIMLDSEGYSQLRITDISGKIVKQALLDNYTGYYRVNIGDVPNGLYVVSLVNPSGAMISRKLVVNK